VIIDAKCEVRREAYRQDPAVILLLDIGNSRVKWGILADGQDITAVDSRSHRSHGIREIAEACWRSTLSPTRVIASNVAGSDVAIELQDWVQATWRLEVEFLVAGAEAYGVVNAYSMPSSLGPDRWAALLGAARHPHGPLCVVDCGTALTIDALSAANVHLGGLIVPGLRLMRESLVAGTAGIRRTWGAEASLLARDTGSAVAAGALYAIVALIDRVAADLNAEFSEAVTVLVTGGDATLVIPLLTGKVEYEADLVLQGLAVVAESTCFNPRPSLLTSTTQHVDVRGTP
jgi:type III pantothenate kinase